MMSVLVGYVYFIILEGEQWVHYAGELEKKVFKAGQMNHMPRGSATQYKIPEKSGQRSSRDRQKGTQKPEYARSLSLPPATGPYAYSHLRPEAAKEFDSIRRLYQVKLCGWNFVFRLFTQAPVSTSLKSVGHVVTGNTDSATLLLVADLRTRGLLHLYLMFLDYCQKQVAQVLDLFLEERNYPIHVFCNLGKDRTGVITALVLSCCRVPRSEIVEDFAQSKNILITEHYKMLIEATGLTGEFLEAPAEVMDATFTYLDRAYGGPLHYLSHIGFGPDRQARLRGILCR